MIAEPHRPQDPPQLELGLRPLGELGDGLRAADRRFADWAEAWVRRRVEMDGFVWTDELHQAAVDARMGPSEDKRFGVFWGSRARSIGLVRTTEERTSRVPGRNGSRANKWVPGPAWRLT